MITVNLLPEEFRIKKKKVSGPKPSYFKLAVGGGILFAILSLYFFGDFLFASARLKKLEGQWLTVKPQAAELTALQAEVDTTLKPEKDFLAGFVTTGNPLTYMMQWCSEFLPPSGWVSQLRLERKGEGGEILVKGYCLGNKEKSSIEQIEMFLHQMKEKMPDAKLSLTTSRQKFEGVELTQFIATFVWEKQTNL